MDNFSEQLPSILLRLQCTVDNLMKNLMDNLIDSFSRQCFREITFYFVETAIHFEQFGEQFDGQFGGQFWR